MGWTSYIATHYKNGKVDCKAEMDSRLTQHEHDGYPELNVLKSAIKGGTYYAAVQIKHNGVQEKVLGVVALISTKWHDGMNFGYKDMDETMGPGYYDCPKTILDLLTPTDSEWANEWRQKCREQLNRPKLGQLPIGTKIKWNDKELEKCAPSYQFKTPWWHIVGESKYVPKTRIKEFEVL